MLYNKKERKQIYENILWAIGDDNAHCICILLHDLYFLEVSFPWVNYNMFTRTEFPEFHSAMKDWRYGTLGYGSYSMSEAGNQRRRIALEYSIKLCK